MPSITPRDAELELNEIMAYPAALLLLKERNVVGFTVEEKAVAHKDLIPMPSHMDKLQQKQKSLEEPLSN